MVHVHVHVCMYAKATHMTPVPWHLGLWQGLVATLIHVAWSLLLVIIHVDRYVLLFIHVYQSHKCKREAECV